ncbi:hypothetical protein [Methyloraptor flagellatus]|jgi:hypothetical protein|uniref:DUF4148 domain-containing protein n=1 Tax=Methyloraptor flagellatus TaxID=3162530 RepID=A0AAU7X426_9HYPH
MKTLTYALVAVALGASTTAAFADPESSADRNAFYANLAGQPTNTALVEGRQASVATPVHSSLNEADALRLKIALERDYDNH